MSVNKILTFLLTISLVGTLTGCDYIDKIKHVDELQLQQEKLSARIELIEKQQMTAFSAVGKQQTLLIDNTKALTQIVKDIKSQQDTFVFTEFNPAQTQYFILNNGSVGLAGRVLAIDAVENGSVIRISLVNLLSIPVSNIGFHATWGNERPTDAKALAKWQQLLFNTTMNSTLQLMPGQWQDINLTLKGVAPNNLKYLKLSINMANLQFDTVQPAETQQRKNKK